MPQPLRRYYPMVFRSSAVIERPALGASIAQIAAAWTEIEVEIGLLLAIILDSQAKTGVHMYLALTGSAAQAKVLKAAGESRLPADLQPEFFSLLESVRNRAAERNKVIHAIWAACPHYPDDLIHCSPDHIVRDLTDGFTVYLATGQLNLTEPPESFVRGLSRYTLRDFTAIVERISDLHGQIRDFAHRASKAMQQQRAQALALAALLHPPTSASPPDKPPSDPEETP